MSIASPPFGTAEVSPPAKPARLSPGLRRVLMIAQAFPPTGGPGVQRAAKFAKYLPQFGWQPVVWSAEPIDQLPHDQSLLADLPDGLMHYRCPASSYVATHRRIVGGLRELGLPRLVGDRLFAGLDWRLKALLYGWSARVPVDDQLLWALRSLPTLLGVVRRERVDAILSTYSPASNHLLGLMVRRVSRLPWVADFRDLWTDDYGYAPLNGFQRQCDRAMERTILRSADAVVGVTPSQTRLLRRHAPGQSGKFTCITNGVDRDDLAAVDHGAVRAELHGPSDRFVLTFAGWFLSDRVEDGLIAGLGRFGHAVREKGGRFEFRVVGTISDEMIERFAAAGVVVSATGYVPHTDALRQMAAADVLLLPVPYGPNATTLIPGKLFEYLASRRPILLVGPPDGEAQRIIRECDAGVCAESVPQTVCAALSDLWKRWRAGDLPRGCTAEHAEQYTRERLTGQLAGVLNRVHAERKRRGRSGS